MTIDLQKYFERNLIELKQKRPEIEAAARQRREFSRVRTLTANEFGNRVAEEGNRHRRRNIERGRWARDRRTYSRYGQGLQDIAAGAVRAERSLGLIRPDSDASRMDVNQARASGFESVAHSDRMREIINEMDRTHNAAGTPRAKPRRAQPSNYYQHADRELRRILSTRDAENRPTNEDLLRAELRLPNRNRR